MGQNPRQFNFADKHDIVKGKERLQRISGMAFIEIVALLVVATVLITVIMSIGRPVAEMLADKSRYKFKALDCEAEERLIKRIEFLEEELRQTKTQVAELKNSTDFAVKMFESGSHVIKQIETTPQEKD